MVTLLLFRDRVTWWCNHGNHRNWYWRDSDIIPRICKIFDFSKDNFIKLSSMNNDSYRSNSGVLAFAQVDVFFKKLIKLCIWTNMFKIEEMSRNFFLHRFSLWIPTSHLKILPKKSSNFELSLSEIRRFSKIRNHQEFWILKYKLRLKYI